jgi:hypothetical protein
MRRAWLAVPLSFAACSILTNLDGLSGSDGGVDATTDAPTNVDSGADSPSTLDGKADVTVLFGCDAGAQSGLAAYYPLDETSGNVVHDCSGAGLPNDGTLLSPSHAMWTAGRIGGGLMLTGADAGGVDFAGAVTFDFGGVPTAPPFSVALWLDLTANASDGQRSFVTGKASNVYAQGWRISIDFVDLTVHLSLPGGDGGIADVGTSAGVALNTFNHLAVVYDASANATLYLNGTPTGSLQMPVGFPSDTTVGDHLRIGVSSDNQHFLRGVVDDVRFYTRALSSAEITALVNGP